MTRLTTVRTFSSHISNQYILLRSIGAVSRNHSTVHLHHIQSSFHSSTTPPHNSAHRQIRSSQPLNSRTQSCATNRSLCNLRKPSQRGFKSLRNAERITHRSTYTPPKPLRSSAGTWAIAIIASIVATLYTISSSDVKSATNPKQQQPVSEGFKFLLESEGFENFDMADASLPGRVSNLTPEQEDKLKEFWVATLQVFGVMDQNGQVDSGPIKARSDTASLKKPKKKRFGMLRRNHDGDADSIASTDSGSKTPIVPADDDKYGQTKEFHDAIASLSPESLRAAFWSMLKHDHPDALLLRFLRARKWDVEKALVMMISTMRWRASDIHVDDDIMKNGELGSLEAANGDDPIKQKLGEDFLAQMRLGKSFLHGLDKGGRPMCFIRVRLHKQGEQSEESLEKYTVFTIETARMLLAPPADTACVVFDMTGFSMANMDYAPVKFMIKCFEANYPESLGVVLVHKAPWIFQGIWKIIKGWLDPVVASKIQFTNNNQEMEEFVPKEHIIKELGGAEDWAYTYIEPVPGENDKMKDTATRDKLLLEREDTVKAYEKETLEWIHAKETDATSLKQKRHDLAATLRDGYWILDPYVRARSYYDRSGLIGQGGVPHFYPSKVTPAAAANGTTSVETSAADLD